MRADLVDSVITKHCRNWNNMLMGLGCGNTAVATCDSILCPDHNGHDTDTEVQCLLCKSTGAYYDDNERCKLAAITTSFWGRTGLIYFVKDTGRNSRHSRTNTHSPTAAETTSST